MKWIVDLLGGENIVFFLFHFILYGGLIAIVKNCFNKIEKEKGFSKSFTACKIGIYLILICMSLVELFIETNLGSNMFFALEILLLVVALTTYFCYKRK